MAESVKKILLCQMGGTIDKDYPKTIGGYAFEIGEPVVNRILLRARADPSKFECVSVCRKDSQDIADEDRDYLVQIIKRADANRILITHGTDTVLETAQYLSTRLNSNSVTVITGSFKPETFKDSDADFNLGLAVATLQIAGPSNSTSQAEPLIFIALNGIVERWENVTRDMSSGRYVLRS